MKIELLPGLSPDQVSSVQMAGIHTSQQLLRLCRRQGMLATLSKTTGVSIEKLRGIVACTELAQIRGVGSMALSHLVAAGVRTLAELADLEPAALQSQLRQVSAQVPNLAVLEHWITQARQHSSCL